MAGGKRKADDDIDRGDGYQNGPQSFGSPSQTKAPDSKRRVECLNSVVALNTQFVSWVERQQKERPFDLWRGGVKDYLRHAETILSDFHDVVDWINNSSSIPSGSANQASKPVEPNSVKESKSQAVEELKFDSGSFKKEMPAVANGSTTAVAHGSKTGQEKAFSWGAPAAGKSSELSADGKKGNWDSGFPGLVSDKEKDRGGEGSKEAGKSSLPGWGSSSGTGGNQEKAGGTKEAGSSGLPGWGSGFGTGGKDENGGGSKETGRSSLPGWGQGFGTTGKDQNGGLEAGKEGEKKSLFNFQAGSSGFGSKVGTSGPPMASTPAFSFASQTPPQKETPGSSPLAPLFTVPALQPPVSAAPPSQGASTDAAKSAPSLFSVPQFSMPVSAPSLPAIKTSAPAFGGLDWAAGFSKPASGSAGAPAFSLPGTGALFGGGVGKGKEGEGEKKTEAGGDEGEAAAEPVSPSFKAAEEEGVESVLDTRIKLWRLRDSKWEDQGTGSLTLRRNKGAPRKSKEANARIVFRNQGGRILLNAKLYAGMKLDVQKNAVNVHLSTMELSTPVKSKPGEEPAEQVAEAVTRLYALKRPKEGGIAAEELKTALEKEVPNGDTAES